MADLPKKINAAKFGLSFADANQIGATNMYLGVVEGNTPAVYFLEEKNTEHDNDLTYWYNFGLSQNNPYILRVYGKSDYLLPDGKEMNLLFTEVIHSTLKDWAKNELLLCYPNSERLSAPFINTLLDILHGMIYFRMNLQRPHGGINSNNIYIVNGRAKLANVKNNEKHNRRSFKDDVDSFCSMVDELFQTNGEEIPIELSLLFKSMLLSVDSAYTKNEKFLLNSVNHPVLLTPTQRRELRHSAHSIVNGLQNQYQTNLNSNMQSKFYDAMRKFPSIQGFKWKGNVKESSFLKVLNFKPLPMQAHQQQQSPIQPNYKESPLGFLRYSRNVGEHVRDHRNRPLSDDIIDEILTSYMVGFLPILHEVLTCEGMFVSPLPSIR